MPSLHAKPVPHNPDDWVSLREAAALTGISLRAWQHRAAGAITHGLARKDPPPGPIAGKPTWYVHRSLDARLNRSRALSPQPSALGRNPQSALLAEYPAKYVDLAYRKAHWLGVWRDKCERPRPAGLTDAQLAGRVVAEARDADPSLRISGRSLQLWHQRYNELGPDGRIRGLVALVPRYVASRGLQPARTPDAVAFFYALYHGQSRLSAKLCHAATLDEARRRAWAWPASYTATTRWLREQDDRATTCLMRDGGRAYSHRYMPHLETDWEAIAPGEMMVCDHHQCDFWVIYRDKQIRPWLTAVQDMRSRAITGWTLGPAPHSEAIASAFRMAFRDWAIPEHLRIDNGKDFCSQFLTGLTKSELRAMRREFGGRWKEVLRAKRESAVDSDPRWLGLVHELGIDLIYAIPYAAWSKGTIERWFGRFADQCSKLFATYCGNSPTTRPECLQDIRDGRCEPRASARADSRNSALHSVDFSAIPTLDQARQRVADYIDLYHRCEHRGEGMQNRTPLQVWATAQSIRKADPEALAFLCSIRGEYKVGGNGVSLTVAGKRFSYGAKCAALKRFAGRKVLVGVDAQLPNEAFAFETDSRRLIARLEANERIHPCATTDDVREAIAQGQRDRKAMRAAQRSAARRTRTATERINRHVDAELKRLKATGTDDAQANIRPVRTGFEGSSPPARTEVVKAINVDDLSVLFQSADCADSADCRDELEDMSILFHPTGTSTPEEGDPADLESMFDRPPASAQSAKSADDDEGLESLL